METYASVEETIKQNIEYEVLMKNDRNDHELIQGICKLMRQCCILERGLLLQVMNIQQK